jgi:DEAD/DEAH box helicase domain-containing protein
LAGKRRELERGLGEGRLLGLVTTNALELGVDIGQLDATLHVGCVGDADDADDDVTMSSPTPLW